MRTLARALIQYDECPYKKKKFEYIDRHTEREVDGKTRGKDNHLQAKERDLEQSLPSQCSEGTGLTDSSTSHF